MRGIIALGICAACSGGGAMGDGGSGDDAEADGDAAVPDGVGPFFTEPMFFNRDVTGVTKSSSSDKMIAALRAAGGWGNGDKMQIDFSIDVLGADSSTPMRTFTPTDEFYDPDCDEVPVPVPANGNIEGETGYACDSDGDCHLIVHDKANGKLYEMWRADIRGTVFKGGCLAVWNTNAKYTETLRGDQCTSADAAGFPIAPLLFNADEVAAGEIKHAIRFILPNNRIKKGYVRPATHGTNTTGGANAPPYGVHFRLRADYPVDSLPSVGAKVVARALQKYGMYHADGGNIALTGQTDRYTTAKWAGLIRPQDLAALKVEDFEVIDEGAMIPLTLDCTRN